MLRVKEILKERGMTAKGLAAQMGVSEASVSLTIKTGANPSLQTLQRIAEALNVSVSELFDAPKVGVINCPHCGNPIALHPATAD